ncbi:MAG: 3-methyl-2-oxobutanoate hydroxymethyltransferase [Armatimonadetes bacterium]|nr:3-methyl-2-oxobutanoate hydroxymethyltransferase [Armatimonadota bacterium]
MLKPERITVETLLRKKRHGERITMVTAYDWSQARLAYDAGMDLLLVGDSLGMVVLGYETTLPVTMEEMLHHTKAVVRGAPQAFVTADMPFLSYQVSQEEAVRNAGRFLKEAGATAVKVEGGSEALGAIRAILASGIPVMGHLGLTPQKVHQMGGYKVQGKTLESARLLLEEARILEEAGVFSLVLECVPAQLAERVTKNLAIPTIGIGAGRECDGQVLVFHDMLGLIPGRGPKHSKRYAHLASEIIDALRHYGREVRESLFPEEGHSFEMPEGVLERLDRESGEGALKESDGGARKAIPERGQKEFARF